MSARDLMLSWLQQLTRWDGTLYDGTARIGVRDLPTLATLYTVHAAAWLASRTLARCQETVRSLTGDVDYWWDDNYESFRTICEECGGCGDTGPDQGCYSCRGSGCQSFTPAELTEYVREMVRK